MSASYPHSIAPRVNPPSSVPDGLVRSHINRQRLQYATYPASAYVYADMLALRQHVPIDITGGGKRGKCSGFSKESRRRLMRRLAQIRTSGHDMIFLTLTYPKQYTSDWQEWKRHLQVWRRRLEREWSSYIGLCWRIEFQRRGAPHFHILMWHKGLNLEAFRSWCSRSWYEAVASGDEKHLRAGTNVRGLDGRKAVRSYVSKYLGKHAPLGVDAEGNEQEILEWGRNWGVAGALDDSPYDQGEMTQAEFYQLRRLIARWLRARGAKRYARYCKNAIVLQILGLGIESVPNGRTIAAMVRWAQASARPPPYV